MRILLVRHFGGVSSAVAETLLRRGMTPELAASGAEALDRIRNAPPEAIVQGMGIKDMGRTDFVRAVRGFSAIPLLTFTPEEDIAGRIELLDAGADRVLTAPDDIATLPRLIYNTRRHGIQLAQSQKNGPFTFDKRDRKIFFNDRQLALTPVQYKVLLFMLQQVGQITTKNDLLALLYDREVDIPLGNTVEAFVCYVRRSIMKAADGANYIQTVRNRGYVLHNQPVALIAPPPGTPSSTPA